MPIFIFFFGGVIAMGISLALAIRRFERRRRREGAWDENGPIDPTFGPPNPDLRAQGIRPPTIERE